MGDIFKNIDEYNSGKQHGVLIVFHIVIVDMISNKNRNPIVTELFIRDRKRNSSLDFIVESYFVAQKDIRLNSTHYFVMKIPNKREVQQIALNHSLDIDFIKISRLDRFKRFQHVTDLTDLTRYILEKSFRKNI